MMYLTANSTIFSHQFTIEVNGEHKNDVSELDTDTGEAIVYKRHQDGRAVRNADGSAVTERITFPVDKLHVYLVKPK